MVVGTYYWQVRARDAAGNVSGWSSIYSLNLLSTDSAAPESDFYTTPTIVLRWNEITWAIGYMIEVADNPTFETPAYSTIINAQTFAQTTPSLPNGIYYWHVRAQQSDSVWGQWSTTYRIRVAVPG